MNKWWNLYILHSVLWCAIFVSAAIGLAAPWYYTVQKQIGIVDTTVTVWTLRSVTSSLFVNNNILLNSSRLHWEQLKTTNPQTAMIFQIANYSLIASESVNILLIFPLFYTINETIRNRYIKRIKLMRFLMCFNSILVSLGTLLSTIVLLFLPIALREDQSTLVPCTKFWPCYTFTGSYNGGAVQYYWGPAYGWVSAIVAACFSIIAVFVAFVNHKEQTLYKEIE